MKPQTPPIDKLIKQYIPSWEKRRRELAARENNSAQPVNSKPPASAEPERIKQAETHYIYKHDNDTSIQQGMLKMKHAYTWMKDANLTPVPDMLFDEFWRKGELCLLYADTDVDKSVLAVQVADSISRGVGAGPFKTESKSQAVLYIDFEHSAKQLEGRYSKNYKEHYPFHPNFLRLEMNPDFADDKQTSFEDSIIESITRTITTSDARILIIDNLTWLSEMMGKANKAQLLMIKLKELKVKYDLSILVLATTTVKPGKPITRADVQRRSGLLFLCDSAFCIGESTIAPNRFYLKQLRCHSTEMVYTRDKVCVCEIRKESNFKQFTFLQYSNERIELLNQKHRQHLTDYLKIMELKKQGKSNVDIARMYGVLEGSVRLWLKRGEDKYGVIPRHAELVSASHENTTNPTSLRHADPDSYRDISASQRETLKQSRYLSGQGDESATNPTSDTSPVPGGVQDPFGDFPDSEDLQANIVNAEGVQNPSGVKNATNPTRGYHPPAPSLEEEGGGDIWSDEKATNPTSPGGVQDPFGDFPGSEGLQADIVNAEGVQNPSDVKNATNATSTATPRHAELVSASQTETLKPAYRQGRQVQGDEDPANYEIANTEEQALLTAAA